MHDGQPIFFRVTGLHKRFGNRSVLDGVSFDLLKGQTAALIGASGSGKTTLLKCMAGIENHDRGEVSLDGRPFTPTRPRWFQPNPTAAQVGLVFQEYNLWGTMTALDNLTLPLVKVKGLTREEARERALSYARRFHLDHLIGRGVQQLSGGEKQRFALLRAILLEPQVLLLDEITAALDVPMRCAVAEMLWELSASGITMILVSHEISFVRHIADVVLFLKDGRLCEQGSAESILDDPKTPELQQFLKCLQIPLRPRTSRSSPLLNPHVS